MRENYLQWSKQLYPQIIYWKKELIYLNRPKINIIVWQGLNYPVGAKELVKTENCKSWIVWKCKSTFFPLWSSKGLYVVCSLMLLNNIYWWRCAFFLNLPHKKNIIQLVFTHSSRSGYMITPQGYPRPNFLLSSNVTILPTHLLRFFKKTMCEVQFLSIFIEEKKFHFRCCWTGHVLIEGLWKIFFTF